jgi:hypothetical protein
MPDYHQPGTAGGDGRRKRCANVRGRARGSPAAATVTSVTDDAARAIVSGSSAERQRTSSTTERHQPVGLLQSAPSGRFRPRACELHGLAVAADRADCLRSASAEVVAATTTRLLRSVVYGSRAS